MISLCITRNHGFQLTFENGWTLSVQIGGGNYCDNYDLVVDWENFYGTGKDSPPSMTAEIALIGDKGLIRLDDDTVAGYVRLDRVIRLIGALAMVDEKLTEDQVRALWKASEPPEPKVTWDDLKKEAWHDVV